MKKAIASILAVSFTCIVIIIFAFQSGVQPPDSIFLNDAVQTAMQSGSIYESVNVLSSQLTLAFESMDEARRSRDNTLQIFLCIAVCVFALAASLLCLYCERFFLCHFVNCKNSPTA